MHFIDMFLIVLVIGVLVALGILYRTYRKYNIDVVLRYMTSKGRRIIKDKGAIIESEKGYKVFRLMRTKEILPIPTHDIFDLKSNGKYFCECYVDEEGNYSWIYDRGKVKSFTPISTNRNTLLAGEIQKAKEKGQHWKQNIGIYASMGAVVIVLAILVFGASEVVQPLREMSQDVTNYRLRSQELELEIIEALDNLRSDVQRIQSAIPTNRTQIDTIPD